MQEIDSNELKKIQIDILDCVSDFCDRHGIPYWLDYGTLLGAIRHKGYIPWDDDIDIGMMRKDYNKFLRLFNSENHRYKFYCIENNSKMLYPFGKVMDTETVLYEPNRNGNKLAVYIDIFAYDNAPDSQMKLKVTIRRLNIYMKCRWLQLPFAPKGSLIRRMCVWGIKILIKVFPNDYFVRKILNQSKKYNDQDTKQVGNFMVSPIITTDREIYSSLIEVEFEGKKYKAPKGYDKWLTAFYGNYMTPPPMEKRTSKHLFEAYYLR